MLRVVATNVVSFLFVINPYLIAAQHDRAVGYIPVYHILFKHFKVASFFHTYECNINNPLPHNIYKTRISSFSLIIVIIITALFKYFLIYKLAYMFTQLTYFYRCALSFPFLYIHLYILHTFLFLTICLFSIYFTALQTPIASLWYGTINVWLHCTGFLCTMYPVTWQKRYPPPKRIIIAPLSTIIHQVWYLGCEAVVSDVSSFRCSSCHSLLRLKHALCLVWMALCDRSVFSVTHRHCWAF